MAKTTSLQSEMKLLTQYLLSLSPEDSKRQLLFPFFRKIYGDGFKTETDAKGADGYVEGVFILEAKTDFSDWLEGFYQALHYHKRYGLAYQVILVIAHKFVGTTVPIFAEGKKIRIMLFSFPAIHSCPILRSEP